MASRVVSEARIRRLDAGERRRGDYVLYWMQESQRAEWNHALEYAVQHANERPERLLVVFGLMPDYPESSPRHHRFLLEGLQETRDALERRGIRFVLDRGSPDRVALARAKAASAWWWTGESCGTSDAGGVGWPTRRAAPSSRWSPTPSCPWRRPRKSASGRRAPCARSSGAPWTSTWWSSPRPRSRRTP